MLASASTMSVESSITINAPEPDMLPAAMSVSKSYGRSSMSNSCSLSLPSGPRFLILNLSCLEHLGRRPTRDNGLELPPLAQPSAKSRVIDELPNRRLAHFNFVIAGLFHMPADADD